MVQSGYGFFLGGKRGHEKPETHEPRRGLSARARQSGPLHAVCVRRIPRVRGGGGTRFVVSSLIPAAPVRPPSPGSGRRIRSRHPAFFPSPIGRGECLRVVTERAPAAREPVEVRGGKGAGTRRKLPATGYRAVRSLPPSLAKKDTTKPAVGADPCVRPRLLLSLRQKKGHDRACPSSVRDRARGSPPHKNAGATRASPAALHTEPSARSMPVPPAPS